MQHRLVLVQLANVKEIQELHDIRAVLQRNSKYIIHANATFSTSSYATRVLQVCMSLFFLVPFHPRTLAARSRSVFKRTVGCVVLSCIRMSSSVSTSHGGSSRLHSHKDTQLHPRILVSTACILPANHQSLAAFFSPTAIHLVHALTHRHARARRVGKYKHADMTLLNSRHCC